MTRYLARRIAPAADLSNSPSLRDLPPLNVFLTLALNEPLAAAFHALGGHLLRAGTIPERERELVVLRTGWRCASEYEFGQHTGLGRNAGLTETELLRLTSDGEQGWEPDDGALLRMVDELCADDIVSDATWERLTRWTAEQRLELLVLTGFYRLVSGMLNSAGVALDPSTPGWPHGTQARLSAPRNEASS